MVVLWVSSLFFSILFECLVKYKNGKPLVFMRWLSCFFVFVFECLVKYKDKETFNCMYVQRRFMHSTSIFLLLGAAGVVAILHSILPDHWVPLAVVARTQRWSLLRTARVSALASAGHVITSLVLGGIIALIGLQFQREIDTQQGHVIGIVLVLTGLGFLIWGYVGGGHGHSHSVGGHTHDHSFGYGSSHPAGGHTHDHSHEDEEHDHDHSHDHSYDRSHDRSHKLVQVTKKPATQQTLVRKLSAIAIPFGVAASPDLTILPVALAASGLGGVAVVSVLGVFAMLTLGTFVGLTVLATVAGYQIKGAWLENHANTITSLVLITIGIVAYIGF
jgi:nickel/cobalt transporter (NicO) family protein